MPNQETPNRLLDAAENLFAQHGLEGTSLRAITTEAGANLAAVNYHFQSKEGLIAAVFQRRIEPLNKERLRLLDEALAVAAPKPPSLETILQAFLAPALLMRVALEPGGVHCLRLLGRVFSEPSEIKVQVLGQFRPTMERFLEALALVLPDLPHPELLWRLHFFIGSMAHTCAAGDLIQVMSSGACDADDVEGILRRLTSYAAAGFRAPITEPESHQGMMK